MENIGTLFDRISKRYDSFNHITSMGIDRLWRRKTVGAMRRCEKSLDIAVGTGDLSIAMVRQGKAKEVVGVDISEGMLEVAREKVRQKHLENTITLRYADCAQLPFEDNSFDAITCAFGVRNFQELGQSLGEMYRVLKPGGQLYILEFSYPTLPVIRQLYDFYFSRIMPHIGKMLTGDAAPFRYFLKSVKAFDKGEAFLKRLEEARFSERKYRHYTFGISTLYQACKK